MTAVFVAIFGVCLYDIKSSSGIFAVFVERYCGVVITCGLLVNAIISVSAAGLNGFEGIKKRFFIVVKPLKCRRHYTVTEL